MANEPIKFTDDELGRIKTIQQTYLDIQNNLGQASVARFRLEQQLEGIDKAQDEYDDSAEVAEFQKYQKQADIYNKAEGLRVQKAKDFEEEAQMYADETGRSVEFAKRMLRGEHAENTVIKGNVPPNEGGESEASGNNSNFKSDVFTINPETGKAVGVLTRSQRRAFEKKYGDKLDKLKIRTYRNKGNTYQRYG